MPKSIKRLYHFGWAILGMLRYGRPSRKMIVIGVTGTDGKTTTTTFLYEILKKMGLRVAMINGLRFVLPSKEWKNHSDNSTPGKTIIRRFLRQALKEQCQVVILEVTSWGIEQHRVLGIAFDVAVITNLTYEHVDLHGSLDRYREMKGALFKGLSSRRKPGQEKTSVLNLDDDDYQYFADIQADRQIRYSSQHPADLYATQIDDSDGLRFRLHRGAKTKDIQLHLRGVFNVSNALAAAGAAVAVGADLEDIKQGLESVTKVPGRMEFVNMGQPFKVIVDFAHTPNGFKNLFHAARKMMNGKGRLIAVYGATGDRDRGRRPMVGRLAAELVDFSILTTEDPHTEDPRAIAEEIEAGLKEKGKIMGPDYTYIEDRKDAIKQACQMAQRDDIVLLCSMGDYDVMYVGHGKIPWSDREVAKSALSDLRYGGPVKPKMKT